MKVDDRLHAHRKTRVLTKSHPDKRRDIAPMGLWVAAGSWSAQNGTDGWVPEEELDRWDDEWKMLAARLVDSEYWWVEDRDGEPGYGFHDWLDYNFPTEAASASGTFGNHVRWHEKRAIVDPECEFCPTEPDRGDSPPESGGDRGAIGGDSGLDTRETPNNSPESNIGAGQRAASGGDIAPESHPNRVPDRSTQPIPNPYPARPNPSAGKVSRTNAKTRLPPSWRPTDEHRQRALTNSLDLDREAAKFRLHAETNDRRAVVWNAAFTQWLMHAEERQGPATPPPARPSLPHVSELDR